MDYDKDKNDDGVAVIKKVNVSDHINNMVFVESWEEFEKAAERLYLQDPMKVLIR